jgi:hypothetical protein
MRSLANSFPVSEFLAWYLGAPPSADAGAARAEGVVGRHAARGLTTGGAAPVRRSYRWASVDPFPRKERTMAFSDIVGGFTKSYLYTNLAADAVRLWNRLGIWTSETSTRSGCSGRSAWCPTARAAGQASDVTLFLLGGLVGRWWASPWRPKAGAELRRESGTRENLVDQLKNRRRSGAGWPRSGRPQSDRQGPSRTAGAFWRRPGGLETVFRAEDRLVCSSSSASPASMSRSSPRSTGACPRRRRAGRFSAICSADAEPRISRQASLGSEALDQPDREGLGGIEAAAGEDEVLGAARSD